MQRRRVLFAAHRSVWAHAKGCPSLQTLRSEPCPQPRRPTRGFWILERCGSSSALPSLTSGTELLPPQVSDAEAHLERTFYSAAHHRAATLLKSWMVRMCCCAEAQGAPALSSAALQEDAGMRTWVDVVGNVHGRVEVRLTFNHHLCWLPVADGQPRSSRARSRVQH